MKRRTRWLLIVFSLLAAAWIAQRFCLPIRLVRAQSMWPTLEGGVDRIAVQRLGRAPSRFDLVVFRDTDEQLAVKRVVAFEGEHIHFLGGDLWIGPERERIRRLVRPASLREHQRVPVFPKRGALRLEGGGRLDPADLTWRSQSTARAWLVIDGERDLRDDHLGADGAWRTGLNVVPDLRIEWEVRKLSPAATFTLRHEMAAPQADRWVEITSEGLILGQGSGQSRRGRDIARWPRHRPPLRLSLATCDGELQLSRIQADGSRDPLYTAPRNTLAFGSQSRVAIEIRGGAVELGSLAVQRDVHYFWSSLSDARSPGPYHVDRGVFLLGDNPPVSLDSRTSGPFAVDRIWGRARFLIWPRLRARTLH